MPDTEYGYALSWKTKVYILLALLVILTVTLILGTWVFPRYTGIRAFQSSFIQTDAERKIHNITIDVGGTSVTLEKNGSSAWTGQVTAADGFSGFRFAADTQTVNNFITALSAKRNFYPISTSSKVWDDLGLSDDQAARVTVTGGDGTILGTLFFGAETANGRRLSFRTGRDISSFQTENDLYPYLKTDVKWWADLRLLPVTLDALNVQRVTLRERGGNTKSIRRNGSQWLNENTGAEISAEKGNAYASMLISGRGTTLAQKDASEPDMTLFIETGTGETHVLAIIPLAGQRDPSWIAVYGNGGYGTVISEWTYSRISELP